MARLRRTVQKARWVIPNVKVEKPKRRYGYKAPPEPELVPAAGRPIESYRCSRRNLFRPIDSEKHNAVITVRSVNPNYTSVGAYRKVYTVDHPEFVRRISERGEVHYVPAREN